MQVPLFVARDTQIGKHGPLQMDKFRAELTRLFEVQHPQPTDTGISTGE